MSHWEGTDSQAAHLPDDCGILVLSTRRHVKENLQDALN